MQPTAVTLTRGARGCAAVVRWAHGEWGMHPRTGVLGTTTGVRGVVVSGVVLAAAVRAV